MAGRWVISCKGQGVSNRPITEAMSSAPADFMDASSSHVTGTATLAPGRARREWGATAVEPRSLRSHSMKIRPLRFAFYIVGMNR